MSISMGSIHVLGYPKSFGPLAQSGEGFLYRIRLFEEAIPLSSHFGIGEVGNPSPVEDWVKFRLQVLEKLFQDR